MNPLQEAMKKTGCVVVGIVREINVFKPDRKDGEQQKSYPSLFLDIDGCKGQVKVKLPEGTDVSKYNEYDIVKLNLGFKPVPNTKGFEVLGSPV